MTAWYPLVSVLVRWYVGGVRRVVTVFRIGATSLPAACWRDVTVIEKEKRDVTEIVLKGDFGEKFC